MTDIALIQSVAPFGFGAIMAVWIFLSYTRLVKEVVDVVRANTAAIQALSDRIAALERQR